MVRTAIDVWAGARHRGHPLTMARRIRLTNPTTRGSNTSFGGCDERVLSITAPNCITQ